MSKSSQMQLQQVCSHEIKGTFEQRKCKSGVFPPSGLERISLGYAMRHYIRSRSGDKAMFTRFTHLSKLHFLCQYGTFSTIKIKKRKRVRSHALLGQLIVNLACQRQQRRNAAVLKLTPLQHGPIRMGEAADKTTSQLIFNKAASIGCTSV